MNEFFYQLIKWGAISFVAVAIFLTVFVIVDMISATSKDFTAFVVDKHYKPEHNSTGVGTAIMPNGQVGTVIVSESESERWNIMVRTNEGKVVTAKSEADIYYKKSIGEKVLCKVYLGGLSNHPYSYKVIQ
jgi:hypothetical protein